MDKNPFRRPGVADEIEVQLRVQEERRAEAARLAKAEAAISRLSTLLRRGLYGLGALAVAVIAVTAAYLSGLLPRSPSPVPVSTERSTPGLGSPASEPRSAPRLLAQPNPTIAGGTASSPAAPSARIPQSAAPQVAPDSDSAASRNIRPDAQPLFPTVPAPVRPVVTFPGVSVAPEPAPLSEYGVKAALLSKLPDFVNWPPPARSKTIVGVLGVDPFGRLLDRLVGEVRRSSKAEELFDTQMVFIRPAERDDLPAILAAFQGRAILTIGDTAGFAQQGGVIGFVMEGDKVRFEINARAARNAGLAIDGRLLKLAVRVFN